MNLQDVEGQTSLGTPTCAKPVGIPLLVPAGRGGALWAVQYQAHYPGQHCLDQCIGKSLVAFFFFLLSDPCK